MTRPLLDGADIVRPYGAASLTRYGAVTSTAPRRVLQAVAQCRTVVLGGHKTPCDHGGHEEISSHSCRQRHCPKCQGSAQAAWLAARERELLEGPYAPVVCTLPAPLSPLAWAGTAWVPCPKRFFLPVRGLSRLLRRTFLPALRQAAAQERLSMQGQCQRWPAPPAWHQFLTTLQQTEWGVSAQPPLPGPPLGLRYLARDHASRGHHQSAAPRL